MPSGIIQVNQDFREGLIVSVNNQDGQELARGVTNYSSIGISTQKLHARGPMGLEALTSIKYMIQGNGQTRQ